MDLIDKICDELKLDPAYVSRIISRSSFYYKNFSIPKRDGGTRYLSQPSPELKTLQYWVIHNVLNHLPVSDFAYAYKKGSSIKKHALFHSESKHIFHSDIKDFFPSIKANYLSDILKNQDGIFDLLGVSTEESIVEIEKICFKNGSLCIGAVSSPIISNIIMNSFDISLNNYCMENDFKYSRYADDIYVSSSGFIKNDIQVFLQDELRKIGFEINKSKTRFYSPKYRRKITGIVLNNNNRITIGTQRRLKIKKMIYDKLIHNIGDTDKIIGYLSFLKDIEPDTYNNLIIKYSKYCKGDIIETLKK